MCTWFEDGDDVEVLCVCGARAVAVVDEDSGELVVVALAQERVLLAATA